MPRPLLLDHDSCADEFVSALDANIWTPVTALSEALHRATDEHLLERAVALGATLYTANKRDFARLHAAWLQAGKSHPGIVTRTRQQIPAFLQARWMNRIGEILDPVEFIDQLLYLENYRSD